MSWRLNQLTVVRAGYGASVIPFPDNRYAFSYPVKQNYVAPAPANNFQRAGTMAATAGQSRCGSFAMSGRAVSRTAERQKPPRAVTR